MPIASKEIDDVKWLIALVAVKRLTNLQEN
jgi:hypothetical protein